MRRPCSDSAWRPRMAAPIEPATAAKPATQSSTTAGLERTGCAASSGMPTIVITSADRQHGADGRRQEHLGRAADKERPAGVV